MADEGRIANEEKFGVLDKGLYEFKSFQIRMPFAYDARERGLIVITHGFWKQKEKAPTRRDRARVEDSQGGPGAGEASAYRGR